MLPGRLATFQSAVNWKVTSRFVNMVRLLLLGTYPGYPGGAYMRNLG
jgi:hypothetical protein